MVHTRIGCRDTRSSFVRLTWFRSTHNHNLNSDILNSAHAGRRRSPSRSVAVGGLRACVVTGKLRWTGSTCVFNDSNGQELSEESNSWRFRLCTGKRLTARTVDAVNTASPYLSGCVLLPTAYESLASSQTRCLTSTCCVVRVSAVPVGCQGRRRRVCHVRCRRSCGGGSRAKAGTRGCSCTYCSVASSHLWPYLARAGATRLDCEEQGSDSGLEDGSDSSSFRTGLGGLRGDTSGVAPREGGQGGSVGGDGANTDTATGAGAGGGTRGGGDGYGAGVAIDTLRQRLRCVACVGWVACGRVGRDNDSAAV